ncbi:MAG TPA: sulfotransferase [Pirellulaceae bacterium]|nr:sulfotransferase [Pirellulaceae bacterium]
MTQGPVLILGAARSGTKLMRSLVAKGSGLKEVSYDVNYLWRLGDDHAPHDALAASDLSDATAERIRQEIARAAGAASGSCDFVEKTVSNILRIPYVLKVFPEARFVVVIRDGRDVAESALRCWSERPSVGYLLSKAASFPWTRCFGYAKRAATGVFARATGKGESAIWGPHYPGIEVDLAHHDLLEVCARQWAACMDAYAASRHRLAPGRFIEIHYEDLVEAPEEEAERLAEFLKMERPAKLVEYARNSVRTDRVGARSALSEADRMRVEALLTRTLVRWGYPLEHDHDAADAQRAA